MKDFGDFSGQTCIVLQGRAITAAIDFAFCSELEAAGSLPRSLTVGLCGVENL